MQPTALPSAAGPVPVAPAAPHPLLRRLLVPSFSDCFLLSLVAWLFLSAPDAWSRLLLDGDTGWHIRTGQMILATGAVPHTDPFSFSKAGAPWFAWEWLADVIYAALCGQWGLRGLVVFCGFQIALFAAVLLRYMLWRGANTLFSLAVALLAVGAATVHYLARPHLFTLLLLPVCVWAVEADRRRPSRWLWSLVPLTALWTNLHGGFLAWIACLGLLVAGVAVETWLAAGPESRSWTPVVRYGVLLAACAAATLANPFGWGLHAHIFAYLRSDWIRDVVQEFQSPSFRGENLLQYELLLLAGLLAAAAALARRQVITPLWILFWAHQSLGSVRHVTVFVTLAAPVVAEEATRAWSRWVDGAPRASVRKILDSLASDMRANFAWTSLWPAVAVGVLLLAAVPVQWPRDFPPERFPIKLVDRQAARIEGARVITTDQWADYLIYRFYPRQQVFFDGRSDFYGPELGKQYVAVSGGRHDWRQVLDRHGFSVALVPPEWALASLLKTAPDWRLVEDTGKALLFERTEAVPGFRGKKSPGST